MVVHGAGLRGVLNLTRVTPPSILTDMLERALLPVVRLPSIAPDHLWIQFNGNCGVSWASGNLPRQHAAHASRVLHTGVRTLTLLQQMNTFTHMSLMKNMHKSFRPKLAHVSTLQLHLEVEHAKVVGLVGCRPEMLVAQQRTGYLHAAKSNQDQWLR